MEEGNESKHMVELHISIKLFYMRMIMSIMKEMMLEIIKMILKKRIMKM